MKNIKIALVSFLLIFGFFHFTHAQSQPSFFQTLLSPFSRLFSGPYQQAQVLRAGNPKNIQADIYTSISPNTPASRIVQTSATAVTPDVVLGAYRLKSQNLSST